MGLDISPVINMLTQWKLFLSLNLPQSELPYVTHQQPEHRGKIPQTVNCSVSSKIDAEGVLKDASKLFLSRSKIETPEDSERRHCLAPSNFDRIELFNRRSPRLIGPGHRDPRSLLPFSRQHQSAGLWCSVRVLRTRLRTKCLVYTGSKIRRMAQ